MYNCLTRAVEDDLFPVLRDNKIRFLAFNPLAGGLLTGRFSPNEDSSPPKGSRFASKGMGKMYSDRFWTPQYLNATTRFVAACGEEGLQPAAVALRWLSCHSGLSPLEGDAVVLGGSSATHFSSNLEAMANFEPLPQNVLDAIEDGWASVSDSCPKYHR